MTAVLIALDFVSFLAVGRPDSGLVQGSLVLPGDRSDGHANHIAVGATAWWEPAAAAARALAPIARLAQLAGRVYINAILRGGPALKLRDA